MSNISRSGNQRHDYYYDDNGNVTCVSDIEDEWSRVVSYNILNLPAVSVEGDMDTDCLYLADGTKRSVINTFGSDGNIYAGPFRYRIVHGDRALADCAAVGGRFLCLNSTVDKDYDNPELHAQYFLSDHIDNTRAIFDVSEGNLWAKLDYAPYGRIVWNSGADVNLNSYLWTGKELHNQLFDSISYDSSARFLFTEGSFTSIDPLAEKYPGVSPYAYCAGNPMNLVDPEGKEIGDKETILFGLHHPIIALKVGKVSHNKTNISTNSTRFAATGEVLYGSRPKEQEERGSEAGAFRHTLWQATITSRYNAKIAKQIGDAHEIDPKNVDFNNLTYSSIDEADKSVDLMNNQIGRAIGESLDPSYGMLSIALKVLYYYNDNGLYTASQTSEGTWVINKTKLSDDKTKQLTLLFLNLDNNGFSISE